MPKEGLFAFGAAHGANVGAIIAAPRPLQFCSEGSDGRCSRFAHKILRDSRSKPDRAETVKQGSVHESGGAEGNRP